MRRISDRVAVGVGCFKQSGDIVLLQLEDDGRGAVSAQSEECANAVVGDDTEAETAVDRLGALDEDEGPTRLVCLALLSEGRHISLSDEAKGGVRLGGEVIQVACLAVGDDDVVSVLLGEGLAEEGHEVGGRQGIECLAARLVEEVTQVVLGVDTLLLGQGAELLDGGNEVLKLAGDGGGNLSGVDPVE